LLIVSFAVPPIPASAAHVSCGDTITTDTTLDSNLVCGATGLIVGADDITLDCNGHTITGSSSSSGISLTSRSGVTVKNCNVSNFVVGFVLRFSSNNILEGNTASSNIEGFRVGFSSDDNSFRENMVSSNSLIGFRVEGFSTGNTIEENTIVSNRFGFLFDTFGNTIFHNNIIANTVQASDPNSAANDWHDPVLLEGNFWSNYFGVDNGSGAGKHAIAGDGIGDTQIPHPSANFDNFPFIMENGWKMIPDDVDPPILLVPPDIIINVGESIDPSNTGVATAMDDIDPNPDIAFSDVANLDECGRGIITRTWSATDANGNQSTGVQIITIVGSCPVGGPTIKITKDTTNGDGSFDFTIFNATNPANSTALNIPDTSINNMTAPLTVQAGSFSVIETVPLNWNLISANCLINGIPHGSTLNFNLINGDTVECIFEDTFVPPSPPDDKMAVGGEFIGIDSTMVLVASTHSVAAWMIPVLVSAIGIGIVIARKF